MINSFNILPRSSLLSFIIMPRFSPGIAPGLKMSPGVASSARDSRFNLFYKLRYIGYLHSMVEKIRDHNGCGNNKQKERYFFKSNFDGEKTRDGQSENDICHQYATYGTKAFVKSFGNDTIFASQRIKRMP